MSRRLPRWSELKPLLGRPAGPRAPGPRRVRDAASVADLRTAARRRVPRAVFDYVDGAADLEVTRQRNRDAFGRVELLPTTMTDVSAVDTSTSFFGRSSRLPIVLGPTGYTRMMHHTGECAVAAAAGSAGVPYTLSTVGTTSPRDLMACSPGRNWFQLYPWSEWERTVALVDEVERLGYEVLVITVDTPVGGRRLRDFRHGLTIPPNLRLRTLADMGTRPHWWFDLLTHEPLRFASLESFGGTASELADLLFEPALTTELVGRIRERWPRTLLVKGVLSVDDARRALDAGADGIVVSNHGGRQLDRVPASLEVLPEIATAVGDRVTVFVDGGVSSGYDVASALALGADGVFVARAYLYGLMAGGRVGVAKALDLLDAEFTNAMQLLGAVSVRDLRGRARLRPL